MIMMNERNKENMKKKNKAAGFKNSGSALQNENGSRESTSRNSNSRKSSSKEKQISKRTGVKQNQSNQNENGMQKVEGILFKHKRGFGFVTPNEESPFFGQGDVFVAGKDMNDAMNGDMVQVILNGKYRDAGIFDENEKKEGKVSAILERSVTEVVGTFEESRNYGFVVPDDRKIGEDIYIRKDAFKGAKKGDVVVAKIIKYATRTNNAEGKITEIVSRNGESDSDIKSLIRQKNLFQTFPSMVNAEAKAMSAQEKDISELADNISRRDLRDKIIITIDGSDSKDFDDAVSIEKKENGNYLLGVHIADVTHYVRENGPLDKEAYKRGNSVYLINQVVPMLPKLLSNGICSLNPHVDRLTLSIDMEIDSQGEVVKHEIYESVICSKARMTYTDVSDMLEKNAVDLISSYFVIYEDLKLMEELAAILRKKRDKRGSIDFDFDESNITLDQYGVPMRVDVAERRVANKMIEEFMLIANETVAEEYYFKEVPFIYRVHEKPSLDKMEELKIFLQSFGINLNGEPDNIHPKQLTDILQVVKDKPFENVVSTVMLRSMRKAFYDSECQGHFGLSVKYYCHFTSPIRRYPDLMIHRIIKESIKGNMGVQRKKTLSKIVKEAALNSSITERTAMELEREVEKLKKTEYMSYHIGEVYEGLISGVTNYGIYVTLPNTIEGMVRMETLTDDYYDLDSANFRVIGRNSNKIYTLGNAVKIMVAAARIESREIDFIIKDI